MDDMGLEPGLKPSKGPTLHVGESSWRHRPLQCPHTLLLLLL